jgi:hypothetical protein
LWSPELIDFMRWNASPCKAIHHDSRWKLKCKCILMRFKAVHNGKGQLKCDTVWRNVLLLPPRPPQHLSLELVCPFDLLTLLLLHATQWNRLLDGEKLQACVTLEIFMIFFAIFNIHFSFQKFWFWPINLNTLFLYLSSSALN